MPELLPRDLRRAPNRGLNHGGARRPEKWVDNSAGAVIWYLVKHNTRTRSHRAVFVWGKNEGDNLHRGKEE